ncbi:hypothetical protein G7Y89_g5027 [Cudoniella acicularis]|uniref:Uncharacterized protein n=1 Tax=Cudoniella acicularis TaxID=354080 RepID=A0A8H4RPS1_9HELO|nr:hypothetical protein G7Y89_g5027 [Cudoniella acicularis]
MTTDVLFSLHRYRQLYSLRCESFVSGTLLVDKVLLRPSYNKMTDWESVTGSSHGGRQSFELAYAVRRFEPKSLLERRAERPQDWQVLRRKKYIAAELRLPFPCLLAPLEMDQIMVRRPRSRDDHPLVTTSIASPSVISKQARRRARKTRKLSQADWKRLEPLIIEFYLNRVDKGRSIDDLKANIKEMTAIDVSEAQLWIRIRAMKAFKNIKRSEYLMIVGKLQRYSEHWRETDLQTTYTSGESLDGIHAIQSNLHDNKPVPAFLSDPALGEPSVSFNALKRLPYSVSKLNDPDYISSVTQNFSHLVQLARCRNDEYLRGITLPLETLLREMQSSCIVGTWQDFPLKVLEDVRVQNGMSHSHKIQMSAICYDTYTGPVSISTWKPNNIAPSGKSRESALHAQVTWTSVATHNFPALQVILNLSQLRNGENTILTPNISFRAKIPNSSAIFQIIKSGTIREMKEIFQRGEGAPTDCDEQGNSLLVAAWKVSRPEFIKYLLDCNVDPQTAGTWLTTSIGYKMFRPFLSDCRHGWNNAQEECAKLLLQKGFDLSGPMDQATIIEGLAIVVPDSIFRRLFQYGAPFIDPNYGGIRPDGELIFPLLQASELLCLYTDGFDGMNNIEMLIARGARLSSRGEAGLNCLHLAFESVIDGAWKTELSGHEFRNLLKNLEDSIICMVTAGADVGAITHFGKTVSDLARGFHFTYELWRRVLTWCGYDAEYVTSTQCHRIDNAFFLVSASGERIDAFERSQWSFEEYQKVRNPSPQISETDYADLWDIYLDEWEIFSNETDTDAEA